jgi:RsmE family RNA methyltransferase
MNRILLRESDMSRPDRAVLTDGRARHIRAVLRASKGDEVRVGLLNGSLGTGTIRELSEDAVRLACRFEAPPPPPIVSLLLALPRPKVMRRLWAQLAAMGVRDIVLTNAERVERCYFDTHWLDEKVFEPLLIEGLQQSGDTWLPAVTVAKRLKPFIEDHLPVSFADHMRILAHPRDGRPPAEIGLRTGERVLLAVGPEGGWSEYEIELLRRHHFRTFSIGWRTLRSDTACIALLASVQLLVGQGCGQSDGALPGKATESLTTGSLGR